MVGGLHFKVLGPLRVWRGDEEIVLGAARRRELLGLLLLNAGSPVPREHIIDFLWDASPPISVVNTVQTYIKQLRGLLEPDRPPRARESVVRTVGTGYVLDLAEAELDLLQFRRLAGQGRYDEALALYRGPVLMDLDPERRAAPVVAAVEREIVAAAIVAASTPTPGVIVRLEELTALHSLHEPLHAALMSAYQAVGRPAEAMAVFEGLRVRLRDEFGIAPGQEIRQAHKHLLSEDRPRAAPAELPRDVTAFTGRDTELEQVGDAVAAGRVCAIFGPGGIGKSALAIRTAHAVAGQFPDGQLYVDLQASTPGLEPLAPGEVLSRFLRALGPPGSAVPPASTKRRPGSAH